MHAKKGSDQSWHAGLKEQRWEAVHFFSEQHCRLLMRAFTCGRPCR